ncbi:MAG: sugar transporter substrate-binding protein [Actinoallomurus sp.]|nr:sugar transporter substrate-binding protein [Actinoallomurus sp.]
MKRLKWLGAVLALAGLLTSAACGASGAASTGRRGPVTLRMTIWTANAAHLKLFDQIAAEYIKTHPNVKEIKFDPIPADNYATTLTTQIAAGHRPDLAWIGETSVPDFISAGALRPLNGTLTRTPGYRFGDLSPAATKLWQRGGTLYAYPFSTSPFGVFVNVGLLKQAGQKTPEELIKAGRWNWNTVIAENAAVAARTGKGGLVIRDFDYKAWDNLISLWGGWGAQAWSEDGKTCEFDRPEMIRAMTFLRKAVFTDKAIPAPGTVADFFAGQSAMTITQISRASLLKGAKFPWDLVPLPDGPHGPYAVFGQAGIGVLKKSKNAAVAADFLAFFTNPANSARLAAYFPPARTSQLTAGTLAKSNPLISRAQLQRLVVDGMSKAVVKPVHTDQAEITQTVRAALDPLWQPHSDAGAVLHGVCKKIQPLLGT